MEVHIYIETDSKAPKRQLRKYGYVLECSLRGAIWTKEKFGEAEGLKVYLCLEHHISGKEAVHNNAEMMRLLREDGQRAFEQKYTREEFMKMFGKNYLEE